MNWEKFWFSKESFLAGLFGCFLGIGAWLFVMHMRPEYKTLTNSEADFYYKEGRKIGWSEGVKRGALEYINYDRESVGEKPFKTWDEYKEDVKQQAEGLKTLETEIEKIKIELKEAEKNHPYKPWREKK